MIKKIDHIVITTNDINNCIKFYEKLGFISKKANNRYELYSGDFKINVHIKGKELLPHAKNIQVGSVDLCFEIDCDINELKKELEEKNITIELGIIERNGVYGKMNSIYLHDYDGNLIEFCKYK